MESQETKSCPVVPTDISALKLVGPGVTDTARLAEAETDPRFAVTTVCPVAWPVAKPEKSIVATAGNEEPQMTLLVTSFVNPLA